MTNNNHSTSSNDYYAQFYPSDWPANPFHSGEVQLQQQANVQDLVMSYAPKFVRPYMPVQHQDFYETLPFLVAAALDEDGFMWSTLLAPSPSSFWEEEEKKEDTVTANQQQNRFITSPDPKTLQIDGGPVPGDALEHALQAGSDLGLLGIEFATKRRNRVNGRVIGNYRRPADINGSTTRKNKQNSAVATSAGQEKIQENDNHMMITFQVGQSFGNCPQYIKPRKLLPPLPVNSETCSSPQGPMTLVSRPTRHHQQEQQRPSRLTEEQIQFISNAETIFTATGYRNYENDTNDVRYGNDASHRGGPKGFVMVQQDGQTIILPDFSGNNHFNTLGNLIMDNRMGITIPDFELGSLLQLSGRAEIDMDTERAAAVYPGALRLITFRIEQINVVPGGSLPFRFSSQQQQQDERRQVQVTKIVQESANVKSFYLKPAPHISSGREAGEEQQQQPSPPLWRFHAGQHLPIRLITAAHGELLRTYSLSGSSSPADIDRDGYRISVKREPYGTASRYLHDKLKVGDRIEIDPPAGDFLLQKKTASPLVIDDAKNHGIHNNNKTDDHHRSDTVQDFKDRALVLLSSGIGVTPILSMLHEEVAGYNGDDRSANDDLKENHSLQQSPNRHHHQKERRQVFWIHGARDGRHHPFQQEVAQLKMMATSIKDGNDSNKSPSSSFLQTHIRYSKPLAMDELGSSSALPFDSRGRIDGTLLHSLIPNMKNADYYICGNGSFVSDTEAFLDQAGVDPHFVRAESF